jgi:carboxyl-terminal processing protease
LFQAALEVANCFVADGDVVVRVYERDAATSTQEDDGLAIEAESTGQKYSLPLVALINENSASASEILVGALQDHGLAKVVGERSFGKGLIQAVNPMDYEIEDYVTDTGEKYKEKVVHTALALTIGKYFTPNRHDIHQHGIEPNIWHTVDNRLVTEPTLIELDKQIEAKIDELRLLRTELSQYLRENDAVRELGLETAAKLAQGIEVADVPMLEPEAEEPIPLAAPVQPGTSDGGADGIIDPNEER